MSLLTRPTLARPLILAFAALACVAAAAGDSAGWYPYRPSQNLDPAGLTSLAAWSTEPAGAKGRIERRADKLIYGGRELKLWGTNLGFSDSKPSKEEAERMAAFFQKFGINAIRHHKHLDGPGWAGFQSPHSFVQFEPEGLDRFDYFNKCLKERGIFIKLSPTFGIQFGRDDLPRIPFHAEIGTLSDKPEPRIKAAHGWVYLSSELQDLQIEQTVKLLKHTNPYTGLRYADDPFLFCVELFNEDSVLFSGVNGRLQQSPTLRARTAARFSAYLTAKYGTEAAWRTAWGPEAVIDAPAGARRHLASLVGVEKVRGDLAPESLEAGTVVPWAHPWFNDAALQEGSEQAFLRQRLLDSMVFLISLQDEFYARFIAAIRETGFAGEIVTSNWQAGSLAGHLLNLHSDAQTGLVDRHNYFGGAGRGGIKIGERFRAGSILARPGMGSVSAGFQQVEGAAFMLSEWIHVQPNEWYAEGPVTLGAYGWGLQGWDVSFYFQMGSNRGLLSDRIGRGLWDATNPVGLATFAAVSRMVRRLDVAEAPETFALRVHVPSLHEGRMGFRGKTEQAWDEKSFTTDKVPMEALAATRVAIAFTDTFEPTPAFDLAPYRDGPSIVSATKQLRWTPAAQDDPTGGYLTIATPGTKGFVGFAPGGQAFDLGDGYSITPEAGFAVILLSARGPDETLANASEIVVVAMARGRNTGMEFSPEGDRLLALGQAPLLFEPVNASVTVPFAGTVHLLDHDGVAPTSSRPAARAFTIQGATDRTPYYLLRR